MPPEMVALRMWVILVWTANAQNLVRYDGIRRCIAQRYPVTAAAARDDIVNRGQRVRFVVEMTVFHEPEIAPKVAGRQHQTRMA